MSFKVTRAVVYDLDGTGHNMGPVDRVSYVNQESYGKGEKIGSIGEVEGETVLVVNVNGMMATLVST